MALIENWRDCWKFYSTHAFIITMATGTGLAWLSKVHPELYSQLPGWALAIIGLFLAVTFGVSRVVKQVQTDGDANAAG